MASRPSGDDAVSLEGLTVRCPEKVILDGVNLRIPFGEVCGLLGPNGSGKTTLLRVIAGLLKPNRGTATVLGKEVPARADAVRRLVGYVSERDGLYDELRVRDHLEHAARLAFPRDRSRQVARLRAVSELLGLEEVLDEWCGSLSAGFRKRAALARAVLGEPKLVLLDEVTNELDSTARVAFLLWLLEWQRVRPERTVIFATHVLGDALLVCDRFVVLGSGKVVASVTRADVESPEGDERGLEETLLMFLRRT
jgi:ABC-2 type transport system ATP-binding protein